MKYKKGLFFGFLLLFSATTQPFSWMGIKQSITNFATQKSAYLAAIDTKHNLGSGPNVVNWIDKNVP